MEAIRSVSEVLHGVLEGFNGFQMVSVGFSRLQGSGATGCVLFN